MHFNRNRCSLLCFVNHIKYMMIYLTTPATVIICSCDSLLGAFYRWCLKSGDNFFTTFWVPARGSWCCRQPRAQLWQKPEKQNFMNVREESNLKKKKRKEGIGKSPLCSWQTEVRVGFPKVLPSTKSDLQRVHRDTSQGWFADLQNIYKGSHEGGTLRHNSPYTRHIHWKTGVQCNLQCNRDVSKSSSSSWVVTDNVAAEGDLGPQPCTSSCTCWASSTPGASWAPETGSVPGNGVTTQAFTGKGP